MSGYAGFSGLIGRLGQLDAALAVINTAVQAGSAGWNAYQGFEQMNDRKDQLDNEKRRIEAEIAQVRAAAEAERARIALLATQRVDPTGGAAPGSLPVVAPSGYFGLPMWGVALGALGVGGGLLWFFKGRRRR
jgi:hypothetical protein